MSKARTLQPGKPKFRMLAMMQITQIMQILFITKSNVHLIDKTLFNVISNDNLILDTAAHSSLGTLKCNRGERERKTGSYEILLDNGASR